jgi:pimeloyl-ACP methyl ester carboxylesterase
MVDALEAQLDREGIERAHIVGNSLGGWLALELARRGRAHTVVALAPGGAWRSVLRMASVLVGMRIGFRLTGAALTRHADAVASRRRARRLLLSTQVADPERYDRNELRRALAHADAAMSDDPELVARTILEVTATVEAPATAELGV